MYNISTLNLAKGPADYVLINITPTFCYFECFKGALAKNFFKEYIAFKI